MTAPVAPRPRATLAALTAINGLNYLDRYVLAGTLPLVIADMGLSDTRAGALHTVFILVYALLAPLPGWLGDRTRRLTVAAAGVFIWSLATVSSGLASTFAGLLLCRALVGVGEVSYSVVAPSLLADLFPPDRRGRILGIFYAAMSVGSALGYTLGGEIGTRWGWRMAFFVAGGPGIVLAIFLFFLREPTRGGLLSATAIPQESAAIQKAGVFSALRARPSFWINTAAQTLYTFSMGGLAVWMPTYFVRVRAVSLSTATFTFGALLAVSGLLGTLLGGFLGDRRARKDPGAHFAFSGATLIASAPFTFLAVLAPDPIVFWPSMFVTLFLLFLNTGPLNAALTNVLPPDLRARGFAIYTTAIHVLGDGPSPLLIGMVSDRIGLTVPVLAAGLLLPVAGLLLLWGRKFLAADLAIGTP